MKYCILFTLAFCLLLPGVISAQSQQSASMPQGPTYFMESVYAAPHFDKKSVLPPDLKKCSRYKSMRKTGVAMIILGSLSTVGGIVLMANGLGDEVDEIDDEGQVLGGYILAVAGAGLIGGGVTLTIIGNVKAKKYCNENYKASLYLGSTANGVGVGLRF